MDRSKVPRLPDAARVRAILASPEVARLVAELEATRWTGRPGYGSYALIAMALIKGVYGIGVWTRVVALVREHDALREVVGGLVPSVFACRRFGAKLRRFKPLLDACLDRLVASLHAELPEMGTDVAIDASDLVAFEWSEVHVEERTGARRRRVLGPRCELGASKRGLDTPGWWLLWLQARPRGLLADRPPHRVAGPYRTS